MHNILLTTLHSGSLNVNAGGPALSMSLTLKGLEKAGVKTVALCEQIPSDGKLIAPDLNVRFTHSGKYGTFAYVDNIHECLKKAVDVDIYHIHGTWMHHALPFPDMHEKWRNHMWFLLVECFIHRHWHIMLCLKK